jgi:ATP-dependent Clp protease ATP-binding subunit ClpA
MCEIEDPLATEILSGNISEGDCIKVSFKGGKVNFN